MRRIRRGRSSVFGQDGETRPFALVALERDNAAHDGA